MATKIISIVNQKGGTGKTTTAVNLGAALKKSRKKVLLIDMDPQGNLSYSLGIDYDERPISDFFYGEASLAELIFKVKEGLHVLPSNVDLADVELNIADTERREYILKEGLQELDYDYIIIDCAPTLSLLTVNALTASHYVIVPIQLTVLSLQGLELIKDTIEKIKSVLNADLEIFGVLPVMVDMRKKIAKEVLRHLEDNFDINIIDRKIRQDVRAVEAPSHGLSVIKYAPTSSSARDYLNLAKEILRNIN